jgi:sugar lactone lactonase YvrE
MLRTQQWLLVALCLWNGSSVARSEKSVSSGTAATRTPINGPTALAVDKRGHLFVIEGEEDRVLRVDLNDGTISAVAGKRRTKNVECIHKDGLRGTDTCLYYPKSLAVDSFGNLFIGELSGFVRKLDVSDGVITTVAGSGHSGDILDDTPAVSAGFASVDGLATDAEDNLFVADGAHEMIFKVDAKAWTVRRIAGNGKLGFAGDGGQAADASFGNAEGIAVDKSQNVIIADYENCRIRRVDHVTGIVNTLLVTSKPKQDGSCALGVVTPGPWPSDPAVDSNGNIVFVEGAMDVVLSLDIATGKPSTLAGTGTKGYGGDGGPAARAELNNPSAIALDPQGNLYIAEFVNNRIRRVDARTEIITTIAGNGLPHRVDVMM